MLALSLALFLSLVAALLVALVVAFPHRGRDLPGAPRLSRGLAGALARGGFDDDGVDWAPHRSG